MSLWGIFLRPFRQYINAWRVQRFRNAVAALEHGVNHFLYIGDWNPGPGFIEIPEVDLESLVKKAEEPYYYTLSELKSPILTTKPIGGDHENKILGG